MNKKYVAALIAFLLCATIMILAANLTGTDILSHSPYDSYTRQALAWREGHTYLSDDPESVEYLELAHFNGKLYVSFPPVPSVIEFFLTFIFGSNTPDRLVTLLYAAFSSGILAFIFARRHNPAGSVALALLFSAGTNIVSTSVFGGVWHEAQGLSFLFCCLAVLFIERTSLLSKALSLTFAALAVGCRPFTVVFIPLLLINCFKAYKKPLKITEMLVMPAAVAAALAAYNFVRFGSVFEFGHNYLPEFLRAEDGQFNIKYIPANLWQSIKLPLDSNGKFFLNKFSANAFYLLNPCIGFCGIINIIYLIKRRKLYDFALPIAFWLFVLLTCMHKTLGGLQFGARYFIDPIPYLALYTAKSNQKVYVWDYFISAAAIIINVLGVTTLF